MIKKIKPLIILIFSILLILLAIDNYGIWTDETYTLNLIKNSIFEIPLIEKQLDGTTFYMMLLRIFVSACNLTNPKEAVVVARIFAIIPIVLLFIIGDYKISKLYSEKHGLLFIIAIFVSNIIQYSIEIRAYSWTILFVTLAYIYFLAINKENSSKNWKMFVFCSSAAFWFHKISVFPLAFLYIYLFIKSIKEKKLKYFFKYMIITIVACSPWVLWAFYMNRHALNEVYISGAILPIFSYSKITESIVFPFSTGNLYLSLLYILFTGLFVIYYIYLNHKKLNYFLIYGLFVLPLTVVSLMLFAHITNHDYYPKYMVSSIGILFTSLSIMIEDSKYSKQLCCILLVFNIYTYYNCFISEQKSKVGFKELEIYMNNNIKDETLIFSFDYGKYILDYYQFDGLKDNILIWDSNFIEEKNSLYFIQTYKLDEYFEGKKIEIIKEFNISNDLFSLCKLNVQ